MAPPARPPHEPQALARWVSRCKLGDALAEPAAVVVPLLARASAPTLGMAKVGDLLERRSSPRGAPSGELRDAALAYLHYRAFRAEQARHRSGLWGVRPASAPLRTLSARLKEALRSFESEPEARAPVRLGGDERVRVRPSPPALEVTFGDRRSQATVRLELAGYEASPLSCSVEAEDGEVRGIPAEVHELRRSPRLRALVEWALDAVHDPEHGLHEALRSVLGQPTWTRLLEAFAEAVEPAPERGEPRAEERLVFRVGEAEGGLPELRPAVQKKLKSGRWSSGSVVPARRLMERPDLVSADDLPVVDALLAAELAADQRPGATRAVEERRMRALRALAGHPRVFDAAGKERLRLHRVVPALALVPSDDADDGLRVALRLGESTLALTPFEDGEGPELLMARDERGYVLANLTRATRTALAAVARFPAGVPPAGQDRLVGLAARLQPDVQLQLPARLRGRAREPDARLVVRLTPEETGLRGALCVRPVPAGATWPAGEGPVLAFGVEEGTRVHAHRDLAAEAAAADTLLDGLGLRGGQALEGGPGFRVSGLERGLELLERLEARAAKGELAVEQPDRGAWHLARAARAGDLRVRVRRAADWLGVGGDLEVDGQRIPLAALLEAVRERRRYVRLGPGRFARLADDLRQQLLGAAERLHGQRGADELRAGLAEVEAVEALAEAAGSAEREESFGELLARARAAPDVDVVLPDRFEGELRDYQREGYEWLSRLAHWGAGAVLADEMGLGKTIQTLALLARRASEGPALVVAPTSVGPNWMAEAARFTPSLETKAYRGPKREALLTKLGPGDVLVTSYDVLARDGERLAELPFGTLVLDEAQAVKNVRTRRAQAAAGLQAGYRVALTGTPLENHLGELYSLYRIVAPGLLGSWPVFRQRYALPIERDGDDATRARLAARLRPFLLRRTKDAVAPELPPRTDVVQPVELSDAERRLYEAARRDALTSLADLPATSGRSKAAKEGRFAILAALTRLRRLACHPRLVDGSSTVRSSKLAAFLELTDELRQSGRRALVFSQFTSHLAIVREALDLRGIDSLYLDGSTPAGKRARLVERFQEGESSLFLISLKAGGTGLNLTGADTVVHLDPWWNPATEDQASDRAHRIGQTKPVTVIRLVAQGTIEEQVLALHAQKRELADAILEGSDRAARLSKDELVGLLAGDADTPAAAEE